MSFEKTLLFIMHVTIYLLVSKERFASLSLSVQSLVAAGLSLAGVAD
jgi:hypothetical protein